MCTGAEGGRGLSRRVHTHPTSQADEVTPAAVHLASFDMQCDLVVPQTVLLRVSGRAGRGKCRPARQRHACRPAGTGHTGDRKHHPPVARDCRKSNPASNRMPAVPVRRQRGCASGSCKARRCATTTHQRCTACACDGNLRLHPSTTTPSSHGSMARWRKWSAPGGQCFTVCHGSQAAPAWLWLGWKGR